ncbi:MAG: hypothetical protein K0R38_7371 [Polyangiaceae bacterium]|jgi:hypothetical protein|nr:hypothetical protein [Polyangiaceae bacterium]
MPIHEPKPARRFPEADELTVQFSVPPELLEELAAGNDPQRRSAPTADAFQDEQTLLMLPRAAAEALGAVAIAPPPRPTAPAPAPAPLRAMTPVDISEAELSALLRPRRMARLAAFGLLLVIGLVLGAIALTSR